MISAVRVCVAVTALIATLVTAGTSSAGGPLQPPDGPFAGFATHYRIPPTLLENVQGGQCLRVLCWTLSHDGITVGMELWDNGTDPNRAPSITGIRVLNLTGINGAVLCPTLGAASLVAGRITASPIKKLNLECTAELIKPSSTETVAPLPLVSPPKKKKR
jgi:hypothetical protein